MIYVVTYVYDPAKTALTDVLRPTHRQFLAALHESGHLLASGPWVGDVPGAYLLMATDSAKAALKLLDDDPFYEPGVIQERTVQGWNPVIGSLGSSGSQ